MSKRQQLILLTGATGYVGGRLLHQLERDQRRVRCLARRPDFLRPRVASSTEVVQGDVLDKETLSSAMEGVDVAYYLVHSMGSKGEFVEEDRRAAALFAEVARAAGVRRLIYLGGLGDEEELSAHLASRQEVGKVLRESGVPTFEFRASIIIKRDGYINETLSQFVQFVPVCPEVDIGLGTPRESLRLVRDGDRVRMIAPKSGTDHTAAMKRFSRQKAKQLGAEDLCGYIFKKDSPTCGFQRVRIYDHNGVPSKNGRGLFANAMLSRHPLLPVEEEGRLRDPRLRENFFERVFAYRRMKNLFGSRWGVGNLVRFHSFEKLLLMAHDPKAYSLLGRIVAGAKGRARRELITEYEFAFMEILGTRTSTDRKISIDPGTTRPLRATAGRTAAQLARGEERGVL